MTDIRRRAQRPSIRTRVRYRFDNALSRGPGVVIGWLGLITLAVIIVSSLLLTIFQLDGVAGEKRINWINDFWESLLRLLDPGTFSGDYGWFTRIITLFVTLTGVFIAGSLIGLISNGIDQRVEELQKGRSTVLEYDHTVILGWSERVPPIVSELTIANESRKHAAVVILADAEKAEMEETIRSTVPDLRTTKVRCRHGEPWLLENLEIANLGSARSVVIVADNDAAAVKCVLAVRAFQDRAEAGARFEGQIVVEVEGEETAASLKSLFPERLVTVRSTDVVAELTAQACRQRGISAVFRELLDFDGDEFYIAPFPQLVGRTYAECQLAFERCAIVGVLQAGGVVELNPDADRALRSDDELIGIAEDDSLFIPAASSVPAQVVEVKNRAVSTVQQRIVITGWSRLGPRVVTELDEFLTSSTTIDVLIDPALVDVDEARRSVQTRNVGVRFEELAGGPEAAVARAGQEPYHEAIVLGYRDALSVDDADARTLLTLVAFRQAQLRNNSEQVRLVAEVLDQRNAKLAQASGVDDFVVSDELTSLMLAQLSERGELVQVFDDLFDHEGCSLELRPAPLYGGASASTFADIVATASTQGVTAIGYQLASTAEVKLNPSKTARLQLRDEDFVVVIAG